jgi:hypothetical protein
LIVVLVLIVFVVVVVDDLSRMRENADFAAIVPIGQK